MDAAVPKNPIELASEPPFVLGGLEVRPATLEVVAPAEREQLEPRVMQVLVALARKRGEVVSRDELIQLCWGGRIVGEHSINRCVSRLHKLARAHGGFALETVPRVGVRLVEKGVSTAPSRRRSGASLAAVALTLLIVTAGLGAWIWLHAPTQREPRIALSAVEPLEGDAQTRAFAKRLTDEVAGVLNENVAGLAPPSPNGSPGNADLRVGGSARREGDTLRVRAYLEDGRSKVTLWSRQYESPADQEDQLRTQVAVELSDNLLNAMEPLQQKGLKIDSRALALWVAATAVYRQGYTIGDGNVPARAYEQVVERAPNFANARGMLAQSLALASAGASSPAEAAVLRRRARAEAEKALRTDPVTAEGAYDALFRLALLEAPGDFAKAEDVWIWGLSRAPNSVGGLMRRCEFLMDLGRARTALSYCERAAALRPLGAPWGYRYARALAATGQTERSERAIAREVRLHPQHWWIRQARFRMKAFSGSPAEALALLHDPTQPAAFVDEEVDALETFLRARATGSQADADQAVAKLRAVVERGRLSPAYLFKGLVSLGRVDDAFAFAFAGAQPQSFGKMQGGWLFDPGMEAIQRDPRFWPLAARLGLIRYWRTRGVWPDFCTKSDLPFDCATEAAKAS